MKPILILAGPTASGKSARALEMAREAPMVIINADSKQVYREIPILTAQPTLAEQEDVPHAAYGFLSPAEVCSVGVWLAAVTPIIRSCWEQKRTPLVVGGTGLYLRALMEGMSPIPDVNPDVEQEVRALHATQGIAAVRAEVERVDPVIAARLAPADTQRLMRAYAVWRSSGVPLSMWQEKPLVPMFPEASFSVSLLMPPRDVLYENARVRFLAMCEAGAIEEVRALSRHNLSPTLPAMKAHGVPELLRYLAGEISFEEAAAQAVLNVRHYIKRQCTWFRGQGLGIRD